SGLYSYKEGSSAFIGNVIIDRQFRGRGLGKQLMEYMIDRGFRAHGLQQLRIAVFNDNTSALLLYASLGFAPYRVKKREGYQGRTYDLVSMKLLNNLTP
ncbi:MAG: GNAT family N-acetyltransferase, partial [Gammaproteobacteria bacterium]